jgi:hypothetical protein
MIREGRAILLDDRDDVASFAASSEGVEEFAIFITFNSESDFCPGFPMADPLTDGNMETGNGVGAEPFFSKAESGRNSSRPSRRLTRTLQSFSR